MTRTKRPAWDHGKSRHARGYGAAWERTRKRILRRDRWLCQPCQEEGRTTEATQVDHVIPKASANGDPVRLAQLEEDDNLQGICDDCHARKTARDKGHAEPVPKRRVALNGWDDA